MRLVDQLLPWRYCRTSPVRKNDMIIEYPQHLKDAMAVAEKTISKLRYRMDNEPDFDKSDKFITQIDKLFGVMKPLGVELRHWIKLQKENEGTLDIPGKMNVLFKFLFSQYTDQDTRYAFYRRCAEKEAEMTGSRKITLTVSRVARVPASFAGSPSDE